MKKYPSSIQYRDSNYWPFKSSVTSHNLQSILGLCHLETLVKASGRDLWSIWQSLYDHKLWLQSCKYKQFFSKYDSRVVIYNCRCFVRFTTAFCLYLKEGKSLSGSFFAFVCTPSWYRSNPWSSLVEGDEQLDRAKSQTTMELWHACVA